MQTENGIPDYRRSSGPDLSNVPIELRSYRNFVGWKYEEFRKRDHTVKISKIPYVIGDHGRRASSTNPATWRTYQEACERASDFNGIGFSIGDSPYTGFDFDHCRDKETGETNERVRRFVHRLSSYSEFTPSGEGVRVWVNGKLPAAARNEFRFTDGSSIEVYDSGRYFTLTGDHLEGTPSDICARDIGGIYEEIVAELELDEAAEEERVERIVRQSPSRLFISNNGSKFDAEDFLRRHAIKILRTKRHDRCTIHEIECQGSHGEYHRSDGKAFVKVFPTGGIFYGCHHKTCSHNNGANHWRELRERYEPQTSKQDGSTFSSNGTQHGGSSQLVVIRADQVSEKALSWLWPGYLPLGKLVHFGGNSSQAKSPVAIDIAARLTSGASWPDATPNLLGPRSAIVMNIEDDVEDTIVPRFRLAGGDKSKLYVVTGTRIQRETGMLERGVALDSDMHQLTSLAGSIPDLGLLVIDPITNYLGSAKMNAEEDVRRILTPIANLAATLSIVVVTIGHFNRREKGTHPLHRIMGAAAFSGVARAVFACGPDPDTNDRYSHVMTVVRSCGGDPSALRYKTELVRDAGPDCPTNDIVRVLWCGKSHATAEDAVDPDSPEVKSQEAKAAELIKDFLHEPPYRRPSKECEQFLVSQGFNIEDEGKPKLNLFRIRKRACVQTRRFPKEKFYSWYLEGAPDQQPLDLVARNCLTAS